MRSRRVDGVPRHRCSAQVGNSVKRLAGGLSKLVDAARDVDRMSIELKDAQVVVSAKTVEVEALIEQITEKTTIANKRARGVLRRCLHFNTTRVHLTMTWVVYFSISSPFIRVETAIRAGLSHQAEGRPESRRLP